MSDLTTRPPASKKKENNTRNRLSYQLRCTHLGTYGLQLRWWLAWFISWLDKTQIKSKQASTWKHWATASQNTAFLIKKAQTLDIFSVILRHRASRTGTKTSRNVFKLETRVRRMHTQLLRALYEPKWSSGGILGGRHIQFRWIQIFLLFYFYSFNIVFEDKPSAVLTS